ncbi:MAG: DNA topoisomerase IB [Acidimicrobiia bacterium]
MQADEDGSSPLPGSLAFGLDDEPGIRRTGRRRFRYIDERSGRAVVDAGTLDRIARLAIPPAWQDVWISTDPNGHLQATGRDARRRKQYRYHPEFRAHQEEAKFDLLVPFGRQLPRLRRRVAADLGRPGLPLERVVALVVRLLEATNVRVGNEEYVRSNRSFGLTTLRDRHATMEGTRLRLRFNGKGAKVHEVSITDRRLARLVLRCQDLPGQVLFQHVDDEGSHPVRSTDVNDYLRAATGLDASAKVFRTWGATVLAAAGFAAAPTPSGPTEARRLTNAVLRPVAEEVHNTLTVCRQSYVHPRVVAIFQAGDFATEWAATSARGSTWLTPDERRLLQLLERHPSTA